MAMNIFTLPNHVNLTAWIRLVVLFCMTLLDTSMSGFLLLNVFGRANNAEKEAFAMALVSCAPNWLLAPAMYLTDCLTRKAAWACIICCAMSIKMDRVIAALLTILLMSLKRDLASVCCFCGVVSIASLHLYTNNHKKLPFRQHLFRFIFAYSNLVILGCAIMRIPLSAYLSKSALAIYGYWTCCLAWMFYAGELIPKKFQPSRFRLYLSRKLYHFMAFAMFVPAYLANKEMTKGTMAAALGLFIGAEACRLGADPTDKDSQSLTRYMSRFLTIEEGALKTEKHPITSHISLLAGCFIPVLLASNDPWIGLSGVISVGIGDAMACLIGVMFGRIRISSKTGKTVEGMLGGWLATSLVRLMIRPLPWHPILLLVDGVSAAVEALNPSDGLNDNILMPLVSYALLVNIQ